MFTANELGLYKNKKFRRRKKKKVKKGLTTLVAAIVIFGMIAIIGGAAADPTPPQVTNASVNPPVIVVNTGITELRVDAAGIDNPIDVVTIDLSPIGGNASTVMFNTGNYTEGNTSWSVYNYTTNASVVGTFNLTVNATDINRNYNDTVNITLEMKKAVIPFLGHMPSISLSNITFSALIPSPENIEKHHRSSCMTELVDNGWDFRVYDKQTHWRIDMHGSLDNVNEDVIMKRLVTRMAGAEVASLTFDPEFVMFHFPLWVGKTWTTTTNVTGKLATETGAVILVDTIAIVSGEVTDEAGLTIENNICFEVKGQLVSCLVKYKIREPYLTGYMPIICLSNATFDAIIPSPGNIEKHRVCAHISGSHNVWDFVAFDMQTPWRIEMHGSLDNVNEDVIMKRLVTEMAGAEVANLTFDPGFAMLDFPLWVGKNWTTTTNVTGRLVHETGAVVPIDTFAVVSGDITGEVDMTVPHGTIHCLVIENKIGFEVDGQLVSCLVGYKVKKPIEIVTP